MTRTSTTAQSYIPSQRETYPGTHCSARRLPRVTARAVTCVKTLIPSELPQHAVPSTKGNCRGQVLLLLVSARCKPKAQLLRAYSYNTPVIQQSCNSFHSECYP